jgi:geranylgeranyl diphosphate synthase type II
MELGSNQNKAKLQALYQNPSIDSDEKIAEVLQIFSESGAAEATKKAIESYTQIAFDDLESLDIKPEKKELLRSFGAQLMTRTS